MSPRWLFPIRWEERAPRRILAHLKSIFRRPFDYVSTFRTFRPETDLARWSEPSNLNPDWDERTRLIAGLVPDGASVIEFGAARLVLPRYLGSGCVYQPADLVKRSEDTLVVDLNGSLPALPGRYNYAVFSGVLEYVADLNRIMRWLLHVADHVLFSYAVTDHLIDPITRRRNGWVNSLSDKDVHSIIEQCGMVLISKARWEGQFIYLCRTPEIGAPAP